METSAAFTQQIFLDSGVFSFYNIYRLCNMTGESPVDFREYR